MTNRRYPQVMARRVKKMNRAHKPMTVGQAYRVGFMIGATGKMSKMRSISAPTPGDAWNATGEDLRSAMNKVLTNRT